jgi:hypothetical protein
MNGATRWLAGAALGGVAAVVTRRMLVRRRWGPSHPAAEDGRWHTVTVNRRPEEVSTTAEAPEPLERLGPSVEIRYRKAPGDRGTEVSARVMLEGLARHESLAQQREIRSALREAKQLWETGEVLYPDEPGTAQRTLLNRPLEYVTSHAREDGRL